jgi:hypothetical protein
MDLKSKYDSLGEFLKLKARLVVLGNTERKDIYHETYSPTVNQKTINLMLALAAHHNMILYGLDIFGAFITADIGEDDDVYVQLPKNIGPDGPNGEPPIWKLKKTLYGLNRSPLAFYTDLTKFLLEHGYTRSTNDNCLFYKHNPTTGDRIFFCIHVDDFAIAASSQHLIDELCTALKTKYILSESDNLETFLGVHIVKEEGHLYLSQPGHIQKMCVEAGLTAETKPMYTPMRTDFNDPEQDDAELCDKSKFQTLLGMLIFVLRSRPDVAYAVNRLATRTKDPGPTTKDYEALKRVVRYLKTTVHLELVYAAGSQAAADAIFTLYAWSDAAYLAHRDSKSHTGICYSYGDEGTGKFYSASQKQKTVTLSSTESETYAATEAAKDIIFFRSILAELGFPQMQPTPLYIDNQSAIALGSNFSGNHKRVRHYMARINFLIDLVDKKFVELRYLPGTEHPADVLTKPKPRSSFEQGRDALLGAPARNTDADIVAIYFQEND